MRTFTSTDLLNTIQNKLAILKDLNGSDSKAYLGLNPSVVLFGAKDKLSAAHVRFDLEPTEGINYTDIGGGVMAMSHKDCYERIPLGTNESNILAHLLHELKLNARHTE